MLLAAVFFLLPLVAQTRFAFQKVLVLQLGWSTLLDRWTIAPLTEAFHDDAFNVDPVAQLEARLPHRGADDAAGAADRAVGAPAASRVPAR